MADARIGRRELLRSFCRSGLLVLGAGAASPARAALLGCGGPSPPASTPKERAADLAREVRGPVALWSCVDLPSEDPRSRELSGIAWDPNEQVLWAVQDERANIVELVPKADLRTWTFGRTIALECGGPVDLEGLVVLPDGFLVSSEMGPRVVEVDRRGRFRRDIEVPKRFRSARANKSLESLTASPDGRYLFTTSEVALAADGVPPTREVGTRVRILRMDTSGNERTEHAYLTDAMPFEDGDWGVADLAAASDDQLIVLERGWSEGHGNTARIYRTSLDSRASCGRVDELSASTPVLAKTLLVDLGRLAAPDLPPPRQRQESALLDNFEGVAIGPRLEDGRRTLLVISDDNGHDNQFSRLLVLAFAKAP